MRILNRSWWKGQRKRRRRYNRRGRSGARPTQEWLVRCLKASATRGRQQRRQHHSPPANETPACGRGSNHHLPLAATDLSCLATEQPALHGRTCLQSRPGDEQGGCWRTLRLRCHPHRSRGIAPRAPSPIIASFCDDRWQACWLGRLANMFLAQQHPQELSS